MRKLPVLAAVSLALISGGCEMAPTRSAHKPSEFGPSPQVEVHSALGAYLAARVAQNSGDTKAAADFYGAALSRGAEDTDVLQNSLQTLLTEGRFAEAKPVAERLLTYESDAAWPLVLLGVDAANRQDFSEARSYFAAIPHRSVNSVLGPILLAWSLAGNNLTGAALEALSPLGQFEGFKTIQALHAGMILDRAGQTEAAVAQYRIALSGPVNIRAVQAMGSALQRLGRQDEARDWYNRYLAEHPDTLLFNSDGLLAQGRAIALLVPDAKTGMASAFFDVSQLLRQGDGLVMALVFNRMALYLQPDFPLAQMTAGDLLTSRGMFAQANDVYRAIAPQSEIHAFITLKLANNLDEMGDTAQALALLAQLQAQHPATLEISITVGDIQRRRKHFAEAAAAYGQALAMYHGPAADSWSLYFSRGVCFERAHDWPKAEADFRTALSLNPDQPDVLNYLGYTWIDRGTNLAEARSLIEKAVMLRPGDGAIVDSLGWALFRMGQFPEAVVFLEKAVELKPADATINQHLGDAYWKIGRQDEARSQWRRAALMEPDPEQTDALAERNRLGQLPEGK